jgi:formate/nitrite transporter
MPDASLRLYNNIHTMLSLAALAILVATESSSAFQLKSTTPSPRILTTRSRRYVPSSIAPQTLTQTLTARHSTHIDRNGITSSQEFMTVEQQQLAAASPLFRHPTTIRGGVVTTTSVAAPTHNPTPTPSEFSLLYTPAEAFHNLADKGKANAKMSNMKTIISSMLGGAYVGMGGMLSLAISGNMINIGFANSGIPRLVFAILFPVNLLLVLQCGGQLFTGNTAVMAAAVCEKKATLKDLARSWGLSYVGNMLSCILFAVLCRYCGVLSGGAADLAAQTLVMKTSSSFGPTIVKAILCNWLVCLAIYLSSQAKDMTGKYVGIFLPIATFVAIGFEHSVANFFLLTAGMLSGSAIVGGISVKTALLSNLIPVTIGNIISGSLLVGAMFSFMYGRLGEGR